MDHLAIPHDSCRGQQWGTPSVGEASIPVCEHVEVLPLAQQPAWVQQICRFARLDLVALGEWDLLSRFRPSRRPLVLAAATAPTIRVART